MIMMHGHTEAIYAVAGGRTNFKALFSMDNSTAAPLIGDILLANQLELVATTTVAGTIYGVAFTLFCLYIHSLIPRLRGGDRKIQARFMLGYSTVIMLCGLYSLVSNAWVTQDAYIKHSNYVGGPFNYIGTTFRSNIGITVGFVCQTIIEILTSAIQIWRVWIIWSATSYAHVVTALPLLCFLTYTALILRSIILRTTLPIAEVLQLDDRADKAQMAIQGATTLFCTMSISLYLIFKQWQQRKLIGTTQGSSGYMNAVAILIESYALESIWLLAGAIIWGTVTLIFFDESVFYIEIVAYLLVQYRVARGTSYESQRGQRNISSLHWNHSNHAATQFGETSGIHSGPRVSAIPEMSNAPRVSNMA